MKKIDIDFKLVAAQALSSIELLLNSWLPGWKKEGHEAKALNPTRADSKIGSFSINLTTGKWGDFASGDAGNDLISLYAYLAGMEQLDAAREIMKQPGIKVAESNGKSKAKPVSKSTAEPLAKQETKEPNWAPVVPVPENAPPVPLAHIKRGFPDASWAYKDSKGQLLGYIWRFTTSNGGKEIVPFTFCRHSATGAQEWRNVQFIEPRPLYVPNIEFRDGFTKLIVEGEKCADAAHGVASHRFDVVAWPGGGKAVDKVDWSRFSKGDKVIIWPDCDAQREKLSNEEKELGVNPEQKPYLSADKQPGILTAEKIAQKLLARGCIVRIVDIPAPGELPGGWDVADAVAEGWDGAKVIEWALGRKRAPSAVAELSALPKSVYTASAACASDEDGDWRDKIFWKSHGEARECRENVMRFLLHHPAWQGCLGMDTFSNTIKVRRDTPTGLKDGAIWDEHYDFMLGDWFGRAINLFFRAEGNISAGVKAASIENSFHPVRDWLDQQKWDGIPRLAHWLNDFAGVAQTEYSALVGTLFLVGAVARIYSPGCKMDTALILEGMQGEGKSSVAKALFGEWFSDTTFVMGDKDGYLALRGKWGYELAELDAFNRSESTRAKAFISSSSDNYRAPYDRVSKDYPRQCVFIGTTNQYEYFKDKSGNRRYWPVLCAAALDLELLRQMRAQLFAEAVYLFFNGERKGWRDGGLWWPTKEEQARLITPEQEMREIADPWVIAIDAWLIQSGQERVTMLDILCGALKMEVSKIDAGNVSAGRVGTCMHKLGWLKKKSGTANANGVREYFYIKPGYVEKKIAVKQHQKDEDEPF